MSASVLKRPPVLPLMVIDRFPLSDYFGGVEMRVSLFFHRTDIQASRLLPPTSIFSFIFFSASSFYSFFSFFVATAWYVRAIASVRIPLGGLPKSSPIFYVRATGGSSSIIFTFPMPSPRFFFHHSGHAGIKIDRPTSRISQAVLAGTLPLGSAFFADILFENRSIFSDYSSSPA